MSFKSAIDSYRENGLKYFTPKRIFVFLRSMVRKVTGYRIREKDVIVFSEIITYKTLTCSDCVQAGQCKVCKCDINELFAAMDVPCSDGKFPAFHQERDWKVIWYMLRKKRFKEALEQFRNTKHWRDSWETFKEKEKLYFTKFYG